MKQARWPIVGLFVLAVGWTTWTAQGAPITKEREAPDTPPKKEEAQASANNLKLIALGWHNYESAYGKFPGNIVDKKTQKPLLSWRVAILPYLDQDELFKEFKLDEPWDSDHNKKLIEKMPNVYKPVRGKASKGETFYQGFAGANASLPDNPLNIAQIADGTSNTLMVVEAEKPFIWTKPDDIAFDGKLDGTDRPKVGGMFKGHFHAAYCDGSVRFISSKIDTSILRKLITTNGGEVVGPGDVPNCELFRE